MYQYGPGVPQNHAEAVDLYFLAVYQGRVLRDLTNIGYMYEHGLGVEQDYAEAAWWYRSAVGKKI